jgi:quercetin dioxygenase-like cupin family protein
MPAAIRNPRTGQEMLFLGGDGDALLEIETRNPPSAQPEPEHVHPRQESGALVTAGALTFEVAGVRRRVAAGESIEIPANAPHRFWNEGDDDARAVQWFRPALRTRSFFETYFALAQDGRLSPSGMPGILQLAALIPAFADEIRPTSPPWPVQRVVAAVLGPVARLRGYRGTYPPPPGA